MFAGAFPVFNVLNIMGLKTPQSAILSAVIFNALIIIALVPLALRGVRYRPLGASALLRCNLLIYGVGGIIAPFIGIKIIDLDHHAHRLGMTVIVAKAEDRMTGLNLFGLIRGVGDGGFVRSGGAPLPRSFSHLQYRACWRRCMDSCKGLGRSEWWKRFGR